jgi:cytochrome c oxidase cbb3-type subunit 3
VSRVVRVMRVGARLRSALVACTVLVAACGKPEQPATQTHGKPSATATAAAGESKPQPDDPRVAQGRELYTRICAVCHGADGEGYKADAAPALNHQGYLGSVSDALLRDAIANGRKGSTMSAWSRRHGGPLDGAEVAAVIRFMRSWQKVPVRMLDERPLTGDPARGATLYAEHCARCHGARGIEGPNARVADPAFLGYASNGFLRVAIGEGRVPTPMEAFDTKLGLQGIDDVIMHLRSLSLGNVTPEVARPTPQQPLPLPKLPVNPKGPDPVGFRRHPDVTPLDVIARELERGARMALLDARAPSDYLREHIAGAASVPYYDPSPYFDTLPKNTWLVAYCACPHAESKTLAQKLLDKGFTKVTVLDEGIGAWKTKGHPVASAPVDGK